MRLLVAALDEGGDRAADLGAGRGGHDGSPCVVGCCEKWAVRRRDGAERDGDPAGAVAGLVDDLVHAPCRARTPRAGPRPSGGRGRRGRRSRRGRPAAADGRPSRGRTRRRPARRGAADVVEGAQHPGDVAHREVGQRALGQRPQRLALEVEQHPAALGRVQHLAEVVVAVDPLQRRPARVGGGVEHRVDAGRGRPRARAPRRPRPRSGPASRRRSSPPARAWSARCRAPRRGCACTSAVASPSSRAGSVKSVPASAACSATRQASSTPGQELLGEGEVPGCRWSPSVPGCGQCAGDRPDDRGHPARAGVDERALHDDVGVLAGLQHPEDLDDERGVVAVGQVAVEDDRGVGLLAGQHARGAHVHLGAPARLRHTGDGLARRRRTPSTTRPAPGPARARAAGRRRPGRAGRRRPSGGRARCAPSCRPGRGRRCRAARRGR